MSGFSGGGGSGSTGPHTHQIADVTTLQTCLDGKSAAGHDHAGVYATPADVSAAIAALINSAPGALDTLAELATAMGNDPSFATTMVNALAGKQGLNAMLTALAALSFTGNGLKVLRANLAANAFEFITADKALVGLGSVDNTSDAGKPVSTAQQTALNLKAPLADPAHTGAVTTTGSFGFATGAGGTVTQNANKSTGVTLNKAHGLVTMNAAALAAATIVSHTLTNSQIAANDQVILSHVSGGTSGAYTLNAFPAAGSAVISVRNNTAGSLSEAIVYRFTVLKGINA